MAHRILVIDDEFEVRRVISRCLEFGNYEVDAPPVEGREASASARLAALSGRYDLILLDLKLPYIDSAKLAADLREACRDIPVIIIAGFIPPDLRTDLNALGISHFLQKPFLLSHLLSEVRQAISRVEAEQ